jgi:hypothetical protein
MDDRLTAEDLKWLRKLRDARVANRHLLDMPTDVVRRLTKLACAEAKGDGRYGITLRGRDELVDQQLETLSH